MPKLKAGIIGLGVGNSHIEGFNSHPNCSVVALCDLADSKIAEAKKKYSQMRITKDAEEILSDPEIGVVSITSYDNFHYEQVVKALEHGKHVFVEKPLCLYQKEANHIRSILKNRSNLKLSSNLILRKSPRFIRLKKMIEEGVFGNLFFVEGDYLYGRLHKLTDDWRGQIDFYSVVYGGAVHIVDLLLWLTGEPITEVMGYGNQIASHGSQFRFNDFVVAILKFQSGLIGKVSANFGSVRPHFHGLTINGTQATFVNDWPAAKLFKSKNQDDQPELIEDPYPGTRKGDLIYNFVDSILSGSSLEVSMDDVFKAMSVCFAIEESVKTQKPVKVRYI